MRFRNLLKPSKYWERAQEITGRKLQPVTDWRDYRAFRKEWPAIAERIPRLTQIREDLTPVYTTYLNTISNEGMPVSLELAALLSLIVETMRPRRVLDLGSGFSSYALRVAMASIGEGGKVLSVDDADTWLDKTRGFLRSYGLSDDGVISWNTFVERERGEFDLILDDLGRTPFRIDTLQTVLNYLTPDGVFLLDDFQKVTLRVAAKRVVPAAGYKYRSLRPITLDGFGRYAVLISKSLN